MSALPIKELSTFRDLYRRKGLGQYSLEEKDKALLNRYKRCRFLRSLTDPGLPFRLPNDYVAPMLEVQLTYLAIIGKEPTSLSLDEMYEELLRAYPVHQSKENLYRGGVR